MHLRRYDVELLSQEVFLDDLATDTSDENRYLSGEPNCTKLAGELGCCNTTFPGSCPFLVPARSDNLANPLRRFMGIMKTFEKAKQPLNYADQDPSKQPTFSSFKHSQENIGRGNTLGVKHCRPNFTGSGTL
jgi:hypothetical protein